MLGKLIKHDFRALSRTLFPLQIGVLGGGLLATVFLTINIRLNSQAIGSIDRVFDIILLGVSKMLIVIIGIGITASSFVTLLLICIEYYRSLLGSQGYLSHTLPVTPGAHLWSKLITGMIWIVVNLAVVFVTAFIFTMFAIAESGVLDSATFNTVQNELQYLTSFYAELNLPLIALEILLTFILGMLENLLQLYFSITIGGHARKHRLLATIGVYFAASIAFNTIHNFLTMSITIRPMLALLNGSEIEMTIQFLHTLILSQCILAALFCVSFFLGTRAILKKKLNLQ